MGLEDLLKKKSKGNEPKNLVDMVKNLGVENRLKDVQEFVKKLGGDQDFYQNLKKLGFLSELKVNERIQDSLNKKEVIQALHKYGHLLAPVVEKMQECVEALSVPLNFPTKNDVANVANLVKQNEEKLDSLEEKVKKLKKHVKKSKKKSKGKSPSKSKKDKDLSSKQLKKQLLLQHILESSSNMLNRKG